MVGDRNRVPPIGRVAPMDAPEIVPMRRVRVDVPQARRDVLRNGRAPGELRKGWQHELLRPRALDRGAADRSVDDSRRVGKSIESGYGHPGPRPSLLDPR